MLCESCVDNLHVGNSVILVDQRLGDSKLWEDAVNVSGVSLKGVDVEFYVVSREDYRGEERKQGLHYER